MRALFCLAASVAWLGVAYSSELPPESPATARIEGDFAIANVGVLPMDSARTLEDQRQGLARRGDPGAVHANGARSPANLAASQPAMPARHTRLSGRSRPWMAIAPS